MQFSLPVCVSKTCCRRSRWLPLVAAAALVVAPGATVGAAETTSSIAVASVVDASTLDVHLDSGDVRQVHLIGILRPDGGGSVCGASDAEARARELADDQAVTVELQSAPEI